MKNILALILISFAFATTAQNIRHIETINDSWHFYKGEITAPFSPETTVDWKTVSIPHSWNTEDILDDEDGYYRGEAWYKKTMEIPQVYENQQVFLFLRLTLIT